MKTIAATWYPTQKPVDCRIFVEICPLLLSKHKAVTIQYVQAAEGHSAGKLYRVTVGEKTTWEGLDP